MIRLNAIVISAVALAARLSLAAELPSTFTFAPGPGLFEKSRTLEITLEGAGRTIHQEDRAKERWEVKKKVGKEFELVQTIVSDDMTIEGKLVDNPIKPVLLNHPVSHFIDSQGQLTRLSGHENLAAEARRILPPEASRHTDNLLHPVLAQEQEEFTWWLGVGRLTGHSSAAGSSWEENNPREANGPRKAGEMRPFYSRNRVVEVKTVDGEPAATVLSFISSDKSLLKYASAESIRGLDDDRVRDFLTWNVGSLPLFKIAMRIVLRPGTMEVLECEQISVTVPKPQAGIGVRTEHQTEIFKRLR